jgi:hypothetical protein
VPVTSHAVVCDGASAAAAEHIYLPVASLPSIARTLASHGTRKLSSQRAVALCVPHLDQSEEYVAVACLPDLVAACGMVGGFDLDAICTVAADCRRIAIVPKLPTAPAREDTNTVNFVFLQISSNRVATLFCCWRLCDICLECSVRCRYRRYHDYDHDVHTSFGFVVQLRGAQLYLCHVDLAVVVVFVLFHLTLGFTLTELNSANLAILNFSTSAYQLLQLSVPLRARRVA